MNLLFEHFPRGQSLGMLAFRKTTSAMLAAVASSGSWRVLVSKKGSQGTLEEETCHLGDS